MTYPVTPATLRDLLAAFPEVAAEIATMSPEQGPMVERTTTLLMGNPRLVAHLAAIGMGVPPAEVKIGNLMNSLRALGCLAATGQAGNGADLIATFLEFVSPAAGETVQ